MPADRPDHTLQLKIPQCPAGHANVALHALRDDGRCDELVAGNLLLQLLVQVLVEENGGINLLLLLSLGPLLLTPKDWAQPSETMRETTELYRGHGE